ncbi:hypothetical protein J7384_10820 [Endozoicomonas sp. G2_1]|uniref:hypothetical protein n=1 Tax=Endozoicomonas sp. G2_1 TaxID=2821091 RepID=UPI001ADC580D|nr:hypothetical protein [Endozoicomonas sp. G2_1]MBO9490849.1 hypothetical protein [Endozoicomonas sp. G2_1]
MDIEFILEAILEGKTTTLVARSINGNKFKLGNGSTLNGCPIMSTLSQPRRLKSDGKPNLDTYCFYLVNARDKYKFIVGNKIKLL